jgi:phosphatidylinositol alpha-mannosyltransferase
VGLPLAGLALVVALLVWKAPDLAEVLAELAGVSWPWVTLSVALNVLSVLMRGLSWRVVLHEALRPDRVRLRDAESAYAVGQLANALLPARLGEPAKVVLLCRRLPAGLRAWPEVGGSVLAHRMLDVLPLSLLTILVVVASVDTGGVPAIGLPVIVGLVLLVAGALAARRAVQRRARAGRLAMMIEAARTGLAILRAPRAMTTATLLQIAGWAVEVVAAWAALEAFGINESWAIAGLVVLVTNAATLVPFWPGNVGILQVAVALALEPAGVPYEIGIAYGIGLQAIELIAVLIPGAVGLVHESLSFRGLIRLSKESVAARPPTPGAAETTTAPRP